MPNPQRGLYRVYCIDPRGVGKVLIDGSKPVIAATELEAQMKAGVGQAIAEAGLDFSQADVYCELIATFIRPRRESQKVVIADKDDADKE